LVEGASPHRLIEMLYDGALSNIAIARQHIRSNNRQLLHNSIDKAVAIIQELQASLLDYNVNELAGNLFDLYSFITSTLLTSGKNMEEKGLDICANLIDILRDAWIAISPERLAA
jgi:flagellar secretion chaperone FliS